jgi:hypothetical protein
VTFKTNPVDESFFETAPFRISADFDIPRPASSVWADLTGDQALSWCRIIQSVRWTSERPFGVGTTRQVRTLGLVVLHEHYFRWEEGRRHSFYAVSATLPMFRSLAEDYLVEPTSEGSCRFTWTIVADARGGRAMAPGNRLLLGSLFRDTRRYYGTA